MTDWNEVRATERLHAELDQLSGQYSRQWIRVERWRLAAVVSFFVSWLPLSSAAMTWPGWAAIAVLVSFPVATATAIAVLTRDIGRIKDRYHVASEALYRERFEEYRANEMRKNPDDRNG